MVTLNNMWWCDYVLKETEDDEHFVDIKDNEDDDDDDDVNKTKDTTDTDKSSTKSSWVHRNNVTCMFS